jgi:hypothetical protein
MKRYRFIPRTVGLVLGCLFLVTSSAFAQQKISSSLIKQDSTKQSIDTLSITSGTVQFAPPEQKSGTKAMLLSAILPGAGQIYAHRYYTIPIIWGFGAYFAYTWNEQNNLYHDNANLFSESVRLDTAKHQGNSTYLTQRDFYHDQRDEFAIYLALTYILNIVDAYVGATLYSFDVSSELGQTTSTVRFKIPIR